MDDRLYDSETELRAARAKLAAELVRIVGPVVIDGIGAAVSWVRQRREVARLKEERKELLLLEEEVRRRAFVELVAEDRIEEARERYPDIAEIYDPDFDADKYAALKEGESRRQLPKNRG